ncbi:LacI family DNA-binding transcriptional regulator [Pengzhenrongella phosphoraccumulans]|uniref:LacI family DNA-binding transcriptional regulator n=1 Tax=Pengzhenrongella phosphoraccumulans TaxID=3114394 RepID=UPI00388ED1DE
MSVTMREVASVAGVSIKTVSNVINDYPFIKPATRQRVLDAIDELHYQPNLSARSLRLGRSGVIGLIIPDLRNAYFAELADAVMRAAALRGLSVLIEQVGGDRESELAALRGPRSRLLDGVLYSVLALDQDDVGVLEEIDIPMVLLGERIFHGPTDHVTMANVAGAEAATSHLIAAGRRRILALGAHEGEVIGSAGLRLTGYRAALEAAGIEFDDRLVRHAGTWHRRDGAEAMRILLDDGVEFDGMFAFNDALALGAMRVLQEAGFRIPRDVAVIGFDDIDETRYSLPTLSTIAPGKDEIAERAIAMLLERIDDPDRTIAPREVETAFKLVVRESSSGKAAPKIRRRTVAGVRPGAATPAGGGARWEP